MERKIRRTKTKIGRRGCSAETKEYAWLGSDLGRSMVGDGIEGSDGNEVY